MRNKLENIPVLFNDFHLNVLVFPETWHESSDSVAIRRLRGLGFNVVEAARALPASENLDSIHFVNHGGITVVFRPELFEFITLDNKFLQKSCY